jgi:hypothetical protein
MTLWPSMSLFCSEQNRWWMFPWQNSPLYSGIYTITSSYELEMVSRPSVFENEDIKIEIYECTRRHLQRSDEFLLRILDRCAWSDFAVQSCRTHGGMRSMERDMWTNSIERVHFRICDWKWTLRRNFSMRWRGTEGK